MEIVFLQVDPLRVMKDVIGQRSSSTKRLSENGKERKAYSQRDCSFIYEGMGLVDNILFKESMPKTKYTPGLQLWLILTGPE